MVMPLATQFLIDLYGWRGALLLIGGLNLHGIICGASLRRATDDVSEITMETLQTDFGKNDPVNELNMNMFRRMEFVSLLPIAVGSGYTMMGWTIYLVPHAMNVGYQPYHAALLSTMGGLGHVTGMLLFPVLSKLISSEQILCASTVVNSASLLIDPISAAFNSYVGMVVSSLMYGVSRSLLAVSLIKLVLVDIDDHDRKTMCLAWIMFYYSIGSILSSILSGKFCDLTSYLHCVI